MAFIFKKINVLKKTTMQNSDFETTCIKLHSHSRKQLLIFIALSAGPFCLAALVIYLLYKNIKMYVVVNYDLKSIMRSKYEKPAYAAENDNEIYTNTREIADLADYDQYNYDKIKQTIINNTSDPDTLTYNENQKKIWNTIYDKEPIDIIDRSSLFKENDNW